MPNRDQDQTPVNKRYCHNCHYPLPGYGEYCPNCSQKYTDGKIKLWQLLGEFFESIFNIDSKIFRTLGHLFIPGKLTSNYFAGRQKRYIPPVRLFFVMAIVHFAFINISINAVESDGGLANLSEQNHRARYRTEFLEDLDSARVKVEKAYPDTTVKNALDSLMVKFADARKDSVPILLFTGGFWLEGKTINVARLDLLHLSQKEVFEKYNINGFWHQLQARQFLKIVDQGGNFVFYIIGQMVWMVVLMMPALALILKLLYIRRSFYFVEHLVFSFHYHAFAFLIITIAYLLEAFGFPPLDWPNGQGYYAIIGFSILLIYLYLAMRRFYQQGRFKTFVKFNFLNFAYLFIFILFLLLTLVVSAIRF